MTPTAIQRAAEKIIALYDPPGYDPDPEELGRIVSVLTAELAEGGEATPPAAGDGLNSAARDVLAERERQKSKEGWTTDHDDAHDKGELADAAACYASLDGTNRTLVRKGKTYEEEVWPSEWTLKRKDRRRNLVRAAALILAEIERLDRKELPPPPTVTVGREG